jgi:cytoskeleton protein RodZ
LLAAFVYRDALLNFEHGIFPPKPEVLTTSIEPAPVKADVVPAASTPDSNAAVGMNQAASEPRLTADQKDEPVVMHNSVVPPESVVPVGREPVNQTQAVQQSQKQLASDGTAANALVFSFRQDSWLQIKRADGSVLVSHLYKAGSEEAFTVAEPLNLVVGNAPGVDAKLRGQKLVFPQQIGSNVVNLNVK